MTPHHLAEDLLSGHFAFRKRWENLRGWRWLYALNTVAEVMAVCLVNEMRMKTLDVDEFYIRLL